jgi:Asp-tRNA(Asn)/Glu-tRNA(Gln) amidotransferase A subunit family amidase
VRPASFCGIAGFKPSFDRLPTPGLKPFAPSFDTVGLFAASVDDVALLFAALEGRPLRLDRAEIGDLRFAVLRLPWDDAASPAARAARDRACARLAARARSVVDRVPPDAVVAAHHAHPTIQAVESLETLAFERRTAPEKLGPLLTAHFAEADTVTSEAAAAAQAVRREAYAALPDLFRDVDALVTFAAPGVAPPDRTTTGSPIFNRLWTMLGVPAISVPGLLDDGLPIGLQLIGPPGGDEALLAVAAAVAPVIADPL